MTIEEHKNIITEIATNLNDQAKVTSLLADLSKDYSEISSKLDTANTSVVDLTKTNEELRSANMKLFTQIGSSEQPSAVLDEPNKDNPTSESENTNDNKELTYENLFNEKGELK